MKHYITLKSFDDLSFDGIKITVSPPARLPNFSSQPETVEDPLTYSPSSEVSHAFPRTNQEHNLETPGFLPRGQETVLDSAQFTQWPMGAQYRTPYARGGLNE